MEKISGIIYPLNYIAMDIFPQMSNGHLFNLDSLEQLIVTCNIVMIEA